MKRAILVTLILALVPCLGQAQSSDYSKGHGYGYFAPGVSSGGAGTMHFGGGGERYFGRHVGVGVEAGYLSPLGSFSEGIGTFSPDVVARFLPKSSENKVEPFVNGGYSLFFREGAVHGANVGGGVNWWFKDRLGLRFEVRDNFAAIEGDTVHLVGFRIGLTFR